MRKRIGNSDRDRTGAATVEFALLLPLLLLFLSVAVDFARVYQSLQIVAACARNGALYAADVCIAQASPYETVAEAALADAGPLRDELQVETRDAFDALGNPCIEVTVRYAFRPQIRVPWLPQSLALERTVRMRLPRSAQELLEPDPEP